MGEGGEGAMAVVGVGAEGEVPPVGVEEPDETRVGAKGSHGGELRCREAAP